MTQFEGWPASQLTALPRGQSSGYVIVFFPRKRNLFLGIFVSVRLKYFEIYKIHISIKKKRILSESLHDAYKNKFEIKLLEI